MYKKYLTECLLITASNDINIINDWLFWHINICKFEHIVLIDNSVTKNIKQCIKPYSNIDYVSIDGNISQSDLYTKFVNQSNAYWVLPIDDDEILYIPDEYNNNINNFIVNNVMTMKERYYKIGFSWLMMFSNGLLQKSGNSFLEDYNYYAILDCINGEDFFCQKTMVNTLIKHLYFNNCIPKKVSLDTINANFLIDYIKKYQPVNAEFIGTVHNPISKYNDKYYHSYNVSCDLITIGYKTYKKPDINKPLLLHYKYQSIESWLKKISRHRFNDTVSMYYINYYKQNIIYDIYNQIKDDLHIFDNVKSIYQYNKNRRIKNA